MTNELQPRILEVIKKRDEMIRKLEHFKKMIPQLKANITEDKDKLSSLKREILNIRTTMSIENNSDTNELAEKKAELDSLKTNIETDVEELEVAEESVSKLHELLMNTNAEHSRLVRRSTAESGRCLEKLQEDICLEAIEDYLLCFYLQGTRANGLENLQAIIRKAEIAANEQYKAMHAKISRGETLPEEDVA